MNYGARAKAGSAQFMDMIHFETFFGFNMTLLNITVRSGGNCQQNQRSTM
jgi:hypothetical protein